MNLKQYLDITPEIKTALEEGKPVVALESTILSHGMPYPENLTFAAEVERIIRAEGAIPATMAIIDGRMKVGLSAGELELMCKGENVAKVSRRDLPILLATGGTLYACAKLVEKLGGVVTNIVTLIELTEVGGREKLRDYNTKALVTYPC